MNDQTKWSDLLKAAVEEPGLVLSAYSAFHGYSLGNQLAAMVQCQMRGTQPGPINTFPAWQRLNRHVKKGEKALMLCMPITRKGEDDSGEQQTFTNFIWKPRWFVLSQTEGEPVEPIAIPAWNKDHALEVLNIKQVEFTLTDGNVQGYAKGREVAISPLAAMPHKTLFHELAHIELGHTTESEYTDSEATPRNLREVEAESVAMLLCESLELPGSEFCRGYIQGWVRHEA